MDYPRQIQVGLLISVSGRMLFVIQRLSQREVRACCTRRSTEPRTRDVT